MAEFFAGMDVGKVDFHDRHLGGGDGIAQRHAGVGVAGGIDHHHIGLPQSVLNPRHQRAFVVALAKLNVRAALGLFTHGVFDVGQRRGAVNLRLPLPQQIEVGAVEEENLHRARS